MKTAVIIPAGGSGTRFGTARPKQYLEVCGKPLIIHTVQVFETAKEVDAIVLAVGRGHRAELVAMLERFGIRKVHALVAGGSERQHSVCNALHSEAIAQAEITLVHDAVRPCFDRGLIAAVIQAARRHSAAVPGLPVKETIKEVDSAGHVLRTVERSALRTIQTPQAFRTELLYAAHERARAEQYLGTDDASLVERLGHKVLVIPGSEDNIKVTTPHDIAQAERYLRARGADANLSL